MDARTHQRRWLVGAGLALALTLALIIAIGAVLVLQQYQAADYPGAVFIAGHNLYETRGSLYYRRDTAYRTTDELPLVYNWYSQTFALGPEARAASACITMERSTTWWRIERYMGVTLCDTPNGRMMYVQRSVMLRTR